MIPVINPAVLNRLVAEIDSKYQRLSELQADYESRVKTLYEQRNKLLAQRSHLEAILRSQEVVEQSEQLLGVPTPAQGVESAETMYLGLTPEASLRGGGETEPTF